jgi:hypothetical protein
MTKTNQYYYDKLRDCYNLVCENEQQRNKPAPAPIKKKKPTFEKSKYIKYGSGYNDQSGGGSKIRTTQKDWDEGNAYEYAADAQEQPTKRKTLKEFRADAGSTQTSITTTKDKKDLDFMYQVFLAGKEISSFEDFIGFVNHLL